MYPYSRFERLCVLGGLLPFSSVQRDHMELVGIGTGGGACGVGGWCLLVCLDNRWKVGTVGLEWG